MGHVMEVVPELRTLLGRFLFSGDTVKNASPC